MYQQSAVFFPRLRNVSGILEHDRQNVTNLTFEGTSRLTTSIVCSHSFLSWVTRSWTLSVELATKAKSLERTEAILLAVINVVAFFGNLLTYCAVHRNQRLRRFPTCFWWQLMSTYCMSFNVVTLFPGRWIFGESFCRFHGIGALTFGLVSFPTMGLIAVSRYYCDVKPENYTVLFWKRRVLLYISLLLFGA